MDEKIDISKALYELIGVFADYDEREQAYWGHDTVIEKEEWQPVVTLAEEKIKKLYQAHIERLEAENESKGDEIQALQVDIIVLRHLNKSLQQAPQALDDYDKGGG